MNSPSFRTRLLHILNHPAFPATEAKRLGEPWQKAAKRVQRFQKGDEVIVSHAALARFRCSGMIASVDTNLPDSEDAGGPGPYHAIYRVEFSDGVIGTFYDHELQLATT